MRTRKGFVVFGLALGLLVAAACGSDNDSSSPNEINGVWKGEQVKTDLQTLQAPLCFLATQATPIEPGQFSGALYISGALFGLVAGKLETDGSITLRTEVNTYEGARVGDQASGTWTGQEGTGTWTLDRTDDDSCQ